MRTRSIDDNEESNDDCSSESYDSSSLLENEASNIRIQQLELELQRAREQIQQFIRGTENLENLRLKIRDINGKLSNANSEIDSLQIRLKKSQSQNKEFKKSIFDIQNKNAHLIKENEEKSQDIIIKNSLITELQSLKVSSKTFLADMSKRFNENIHSFDDLTNIINKLIEKKNDENDSLLKENKKLSRIIKHASKDMESTESLRIKVESLQHELHKTKSEANQSFVLSQQESQEMKSLLLKSGDAIQSLESTNKMLQMQISECNRNNAKIAQERDELFDQMKLLKESFNENVNQQNQTEIQDKNNKIVEQQKIISTFQVRIADYEKKISQSKQIIQDHVYSKGRLKKDINSLKKALVAMQKRNSELITKCSNVQLENVTLASKLQSTKELLSATKAQINDQNHQLSIKDTNQFEYDGIIKIFEGIIKTQQSDLTKSVQMRNKLSSLIIAQNNIIIQSELELEKQLKLVNEQKAQISKLSRRPKPQPITEEEKASFCIKTIQDLLLPFLDGCQQNHYKELLQENISSIQRCKNLLSAILENMMEKPKEPVLFIPSELIEWMKRLVFFMESSGNNDQDSISRMIDWINKLCSSVNLRPDMNFEEALKNVSANHEAFKLLETLYYINGKQFEILKDYEKAMKENQESIEQIISNIGCSNSHEIVDSYKKMIEKLKFCQDKCNKHTKTIDTLQEKIRNKKHEIDDLNNQIKNNETNRQNEIAEHAAKIEILTKQITDQVQKYDRQNNSIDAMKSSISSKNKQINELKNRLNEAQDALSDAQQRLIFEATNHSQMLDDIKKDSENDVHFANNRIKEIIQEYESRLQTQDLRFQNEINEYKDKAISLKLQHKMIESELQKVIESNDDRISDFITKMKNNEQMIEAQKQEISHLRLEIKALECKLQTETNQKLCFGHIIQTSLYK